MSDSSDYITQRIDKAHGLAAWSYLGIIIPLIGIILAGYSQSIINSIDREKASKHDVGRIKGIQSLGSVGFILSIIVTIIWLVKLA